MITNGTGGPLNLNGANYNLFTVNQLAGQTETVTIDAALSDNSDNFNELAKAGNGTLILGGTNIVLTASSRSIMVYWTSILVSQAADNQHPYR